MGKGVDKVHKGQRLTCDGIWFDASCDVISHRSTLGTFNPMLLYEYAVPNLLTILYICVTRIGLRMSYKSIGHVHAISLGKNLNAYQQNSLMKLATSNNIKIRLRKGFIFISYLLYYLFIFYKYYFFSLKGKSLFIRSLSLFFLVSLVLINIKIILILKIFK